MSSSGSSGGKAVGSGGRSGAEKKEGYAKYVYEGQGGYSYNQTSQTRGFLSGSDGQRVWTTFKYERLPLFCHFCGLLGHDLKHCAGYFALVKKENEVQCPYGEWLKASGGRPWASFKRDPDRSYYPRSGTEKGNGEVEDSGDEVAATHNYSPNPSLHEKREERFSENLGSAQDTGAVIAKNQGGRSVNGRLETDIDWLDMDGIGCDNSNLQLTSEINEAETFDFKCERKR